MIFYLEYYSAEDRGVESEMGVSDSEEFNGELEECMDAVIEKAHFGCNGISPKFLTFCLQVQKLSIQHINIIIMVFLLIL